MLPVTKKPWFGPRRFGWGWTPITWEGWIATLVALAAIVIAGVVLSRTARAITIIVLVGALILVCYLTSGAPGSTCGRRTR